MKNLLIASLLFFPLFIFSQDFSFEKGNILKDRQFLIDNNEISAVDKNGNFVSIRPHWINGSLRNYFVEFYNDLSFTSRKEITTKNTTQILKVFVRDNKAHVLIKEVTKERVELRFDIINLANSELTKQKLISIDKEVDSEIFKALKSDTNIIIDYTHRILISFPFVKNKHLFTQTYIFNNELNMLYESTYSPNPDISKNHISFLNAFQHNNKEYLLFNYEINDQKHYHLVELNNNNSKDLLIPVDHNFYEIINSAIFDNSLIISGLVSKKRKGSYKGFSYYKIDLQNFTLKNQKYSPFLSENISEYFHGLFKGSRDVDLQSIFVDSSGNTYIVGQFYKPIKQTIPIGPAAFLSVGSVTVFITYNPISFKTKEKMYDDILVAKIGKDGSLIWDSLLELRTTTKAKSISYHRDSSYFTFFDNDQINILMNGYIDLEKDKLIVKQDKRKGKTNFYDVIISPEGKITPNILLSNSDFEVIFKAHKTLTTNNDALYILGQGNMRKQLIKLKF